MMRSNPWIPIRDALRMALAGPLPGPSAQQLAFPEDIARRFDPADAAGYGPAAVLLALFPVSAGGSLEPAGRVEARFAFPLIRRASGTGRHAGQIALPGGECGADETSPACALREAEEEIGLPATSVEVLGMLTPLPVPVSRYRIHPVVGWLDSAPAPFTPQPEEVEGVFLADPDRLATEGPRGRFTRERDGTRLEVPCYVVPDPPREPARVWGATAMILAEFLAVWAMVRGERVS